ncbi:dTDP-4-dehydrorhamnose reductase [Sandarakinorhabdus limnophila]|uniref:dTDP-4-dehydrorhamnose reductase n=1 Tax=Sandarakinorhabdus limnophila TaxID=210512 RepID=UPI0031381C80
MRVLVAGSGGQLGRALATSAPGGVTLIAPPEAEFDIGNAVQVAAVVADTKPDLLINAAAWTAVDKAEAEEAAALLVNATAVGHLAAAAATTGSRFVQISTDYVFDGQACQPYGPDTPPAPASAYGRTKLAGEQAAAAHHPAPLIIRTAWVYAAQGNNFVRTMLRLMAERDEVRVVADQVGTPTHALSLARAIWALQGHSGVFHWTDAGITSWYDFAVAIQDEALRMGLLTRHVPIIPIATADYPTPARRPAWSVLDKGSSWAITGPGRHWRHELIVCLKDLTK